ncbi:putative NAC domain-containing protein 8 [Cocos nucifera]|nr:putative NAC domain-containing protein 8 [Cocos nucifera]
MDPTIAIDGSTDKVKIRAGDMRWMDDLDCMPLIKRRRLLLSSTSSPSVPASSNRPPIDMVVKRVSPGASQEWPGLPRGVKFDPSDGDLLWHLRAKVGKGEADPHPLIGEFITSLDEDDGFGYTHPQKLPGVKKDGSVSYFFHRSFKIYNTKNPKLWMVHNDDSEDIFWQKVGKTRPVIVDGSHQGCKKIMVLYASMKKGKKPEKSNWVMHQYHLGTGNGEKRGLVVSKIFYENAQGLSPETVKAIVAEAEPLIVAKLVVFHSSLSKLCFCCSPTVMESQMQKTGYHETKCNENRACAGGRELDKYDNCPTEDSKQRKIKSQVLSDVYQSVESFLAGGKLHQEQSSCAAELWRTRSCISDDFQANVKILKNNLKDVSMGDCDLVSEGNKTSGLVVSIAMNSDLVRPCSLNAADSNSEHLQHANSLGDSQEYISSSNLIASSGFKGHTVEQGGNDLLQLSNLPDYSTEIKVAHSDYMQTNPQKEGLEDTDMELFAGECEKEDLDHVALQECCNMLSSTYSVSSDLNGSRCCQDCRACTSKPCPNIALHAQDGGFISRTETDGTLTNHLGTENCGKDILGLLQDISSGPFIHLPSTQLPMGECCADSVPESNDAKSMNNLMFNSPDSATAGFDPYLQTSLNCQLSVSLKDSHSLENHENNYISVYRTSRPEVKPQVQSNKCASDQSQPLCSELSAQQVQLKVEPLEEDYVNNISGINAAVLHSADKNSSDKGRTTSACTATPCTPDANMSCLRQTPADQNDGNQVYDSILPTFPVEVKVELLKESGINNVPEADAENHLSLLLSNYPTEVSRAHTQSSKDHFLANSSFNGNKSQENLSTNYLCSDQNSLPENVINSEAPKLQSSKIPGFISTYLENSCTVSQSSAKAGNHDNISSSGDSLLEESGRNCSGQVSFLEKVHAGASNILSNSVQVKAEPLEGGLFSRCEDHLSSFPESDTLEANVKRETCDELSVDVIDHIPKVGHAMIPISGIVSNLDYKDNLNCSQQAVPYCPIDGSINSINAKSSHFSLRRRRKKTATSVVDPLSCFTSHFYIL